MQILVPATKPFVGFVGPNPGLTLVSQTNSYTNGPFGTAHGARIEVSPEVVWGDVGTKFPHPKMAMMSVYTLCPYIHAGH